MTLVICLPVLLGLAWGVARLAQDNILWCGWDNENRVRRALARRRRNW